MKKHDLALIIMGLAIIAVTAAAIILNGTPIDNQQIALDQQKKETMSRYRSYIENYYSIEQSMPESIAQAQSALSSVQPDMDPSIEYRVIETTRYELCTTFQTSNLEDYERMRIVPDPNSGIVSEAHDKGYACLSYRIPQYILDKQMAPTYREPPAPAPAQ